MAIAKTVGSRIAALRKAKGLSQKDLATLTGLDRSFISETEGGKKNISISTLEKFARALEVSMGSLLDDSSAFPANDD